MLYDEDSNLKLPENITTLIRGDENDVDSKGTLDHLALERMEIEAHIFRDSGSADFGLLKYLFAGRLDTVSAGVIQEAKRFTIIEEDGTWVEAGVAVRLAVATSSKDLQASLSTENLAAAAQLGLAETRIKIKVIGFLGDIVDLPAVGSLDVKNYQGYLDAFKKIQDQVFSVEGRKDWKTTILSYKESP